MSWLIRNWPKQAANRRNRFFLSAITVYCLAGNRSRYFFSVGCSMSYMMGVSTSMAPFFAASMST